jgi:hypothetical protein
MIIDVITLIHLERGCGLFLKCLHRNSFRLFFVLQEAFFEYDHLRTNVII